MSLKEKILEAGIENCLFLVPMRPVQTVFGLISYTSSSDPEVVVPAEISEKRYKLEDNHKITLRSMYKQFGQEHFYLSDLNLMIERGTVQMFIRA
jgi:hypothetical protein